MGDLVLGLSQNGSRPSVVCPFLSVCAIFVSPLRQLIKIKTMKTISVTTIQFKGLGTTALIQFTASALTVVKFIYLSLICSIVGLLTRCNKQM